MTLSRAALAMLVFLTLARGAGAQGGDSPLRDTIDARTRAFFTASRTPGLAVGVMKDGKVVYTGGFGVTAVGGGSAVTPRTVFHLASISKTFVATAVMQLAAEGRVRLNDPVVKYVPDFRLKDPWYKYITVRQVLTHTAGLPDVTDYGWDTPEHDDAALARWIKSLADSNMIAAPGERWQYSNIGFELLADLVALVSGESFEDYVQNHILVPAGMTSSTFLMPAIDSTLLAAGHEWTRSGLQRQGYPYNRAHAGSSTMHSNIDDMLRYGAIQARALRPGGTRLLDPAWQDTMWSRERNISLNFAGRSTPVRRATALPLNRVDMTLGWFRFDIGGHEILNHDGEDRGFRSSLYLSPEHEIVVVVLTNSGVDIDELSLGLLGVVMRSSPEMARGDAAEVAQEAFGYAMRQPGISEALQSQPLVIGMRRTAATLKAAFPGDTVFAESLDFGRPFAPKELSEISRCVVVPTPRCDVAGKAVVLSILSTKRQADSLVVVQVEAVVDDGILATGSQTTTMMLLLSRIAGHWQVTKLLGVF